MFYYRDRDGQPVRTKIRRGVTEVLLPSGKWSQVSVDLSHDAVPVSLSMAQRSADLWCHPKKAPQLE